MRNLLLLLAVVMLITVNAKGQAPSDTTITVLQPNVDLTVGYVFSDDINGFKSSVSFNNILLQRIGFYTSIEAGKDDYFMNIVGTSVTVVPKLYAFLGIDVFSKKGLIHTTTGLRKELGIAYLPYKWIVVRAGWSTAVGPTLAAGVKIPLKK